MTREELLEWLSYAEAEFDRRGLDTYAMVVCRAAAMLQRDGETIKAMRRALTLAEGALIMASPCAHPECLADQKEWLEMSIHSVRIALKENNDGNA